MVPRWCPMAVGSVVTGGGGKDVMIVVMEMLVVTGDVMRVVTMR